MIEFSSYCPRCGTEHITPRLDLDEDSQVPESIIPIVCNRCGYKHEMNLRAMWNAPKGERANEYDN